MTYADIISRIINVMSLTGFLLIFISLPLFFMGIVTISWLALAILILAPSIMSFLQLSLSRMREFDADHQAVLLTGDPEGLALALRKLETYDTSIFDLLFGRSQNASTPSILRTHPDTEERIEQLRRLKTPLKPGFNYSNRTPFAIPVHFQKLVRKPRWHLGGFWY
jgi:heat shock protein HtpX